VLLAAVLTATLIPTTDASEAARPAQDDGGATSITDGLPVAPVGDTGRSGREAIPSVVLADSGVARAVTREAADGDDVAVIVRLRRQVDVDAITDDALAAAVHAAIAERDVLASRGLADPVENRRVAEAGQDARAVTVVDALRSFAADNGSPVAGILEQLVANGHARDVEPYWIFNGWSATVDAEALRQLESSPDVASVTLDASLQLPPVDPDDGRASLPTWGLERVRATDVWSEYADRGRGVVVGIMDSGVDGTHPALARSFRGADGDLAKSWFVATNENYATPGDGFGHGTHVAGTILGGPPGEVVGVAPHAMWIAAKVFNDNGASTTSGLHRAFQWMLAPGGDPAAAPDLVNNSWGSAATTSRTYWPDVEAWIAAGIVPIFANGNDGPGPSTVGSPGSFPRSFAVGATDVNDVVAGFSSRGPVVWDGVTYTKPNLAAPGHHVYSAVPPRLGLGDYAELSGTSMATPHVSGVAALLLAANPSLGVNDVENILTSTARREPHMGALPDNDYGSGIVDAYAAVTTAIDSGTLSGTVTGPDGPVAARLTVVGTEWTTVAVPDTGQYLLTIPSGTHDVRVTAPGYEARTIRITIAPGQALTNDVVLDRARVVSVTGTVSSATGPIEGAEVAFEDSGLGVAVTDATGTVTVGVPAGSYTMTVRATGFKPWSGSIKIPQRTTFVARLTALTTRTAAGWSQYQNNPAHSGATPAAVAPRSLTRAWAVDTGPGITFSSPVIADGRVFVGTNDGQLQARDVVTGALRWSRDVGDQLRGAPAVSAGVVVFGGGLAGGINGLDAATGDVLWHVDTPGQLTVYSQPAIVDGVAYVNTGPSEVADSVYAIDVATGAVRWTTPAAEGIFNGPAADSDHVYVASADERALVALDRSTGAEAWRLTRDDESFFSAPSVADGLVYATTTSDAAWDGSFLAVNAADGSIAWENTTHGDAQGGSPAVYGDWVFSGTHANGAVVAYDRVTGRVAWRHQDGGPVSSALMTTADGYVLGGTQIDSVVFALDAATGERVWVDDVNANVTSAGAYDDGVFVTADTSGMLYAYFTTGTIAGTVTGPAGPVPASVRILETGTATTSDVGTGSYSLDERPGTYQVRASAYGFEAEIQQVTVRAGRTAMVDFELGPVEHGSIAGTVVDDDGDPLPGASVSIDGAPVDPVTTGPDGTFSFPEVAAGSHDLTVDKAAYQPFSTPVTVTAGEETRVDVTLHRYLVAVTGDYQGMLAAQLAKLGYPADETTYAEVTAHPDHYRVVLANGADDRPAAGVIQPFIDATDAAGTSVIWLDAWSNGYGSIFNLSQQTGDPASVVTNFAGTGRVMLRALADHPLTKSLTVGTRVPVLANDNEWAGFTGYSGVTLADLYTDETGKVGSGIAYKPRTANSVHVLLSTLAAAPWGRPDVEWLPIVPRLIGDAVEYALHAEFAVIEGTVADESGAPIAGATVTAVGTGFQATTTADGRYRLLLDPGHLTLRFRSPGAEPVEHAVDVGGGETRTLDVTLHPAGVGSVAGTVTDRAGSAISGATVSLTGTTHRTTTAADGTYTLPGVLAERYTLEVSAAGYFTGRQPVSVIAGQTTTADAVLRDAPHVGIIGDFQNSVANLLQAAGLSTEQLTWTSTARIPSLDVVVFNDPPTPTAAQFASWLNGMDAQHVSGVFADGFFSSDGGVRLLRQFTGNPSQPRVQIDDVGEISFAARDASHPVFDGLGPNPAVLIPGANSTAIPGYTGFPVADARSELGGTHGVAVTYQPRTPSSIHLLLGGLISDILHSPTEDWTEDGRRLYVNAVLFAAEPALGTVRGTVTGAGSRPVVGTVSVDGTAQQVTTSADGTYALNLPPGDYTLRFAGFGYEETATEVTVERGGTVTADAALEPKADAATVSGIVASAGQPVAGATVALLGTPRRTTTAADGSYAIPLVEPGAYRIDVTRAGYLRHQAAITVSGPTTHDVDLRVTARVGVIDDFQGRLAAYLTYWGYTPSALAWSNTAAVANLDLVVANLASASGFDPTAAGLQAFDKAALDAGISVIWLDQFGRGSFRYLTDYIRDPGGNGEDRSDGVPTVTVTDPDHPIMAGLPSSFPLVAEDAEYSWFSDFDGSTLATVSSDSRSGLGLVGERPRGAAGVDVLVGTLSVSTWGHPTYGDVVGLNWTAPAERLLRNAIRYAIDAPPAGGTVSGTLRSATGPLGGTVTVVETGRRYSVGPDGTFVVGLPAGRWTLRGAATNYAAAEVSVTVGVGEEVAQDIALDLLPHGDIAGTVRNPNGAPVAGVTVRVGGTAFTATTAPDGTYSITGVPEGDYTVSAAASGHQTARRAVTVVAGQVVTADFTVGPAMHLALLGDFQGSLRSLLARDGYVITDYSTSQFAQLATQIGQYDVVVLNRGATASTLPAFASVLDAAVAHNVSVVAGGQWGGDAIQSAHEVRNDPQTVTWDFVPSPISYVPTSSHPIFAGFPVGEPVTIIDDPAGGNQQYLTFDDYSGETIADVRANGDGADLGGGVGIRYTGTSSVEVLLGSLSAATYGRPGLEWTAEGEQIYLNAISFAATATRGEVSGTVTSGGEAVAAATVRLVEVGVSTRTDQSGRYSFLAPDGAHTVRVEALGYEPAEQRVMISDAGSVTADFSLTPLPRGELTGSVTSTDGTPVAGATVVGSGAEGFTAATRPDGRYRAAGLLDGRYDVTVSADGYLPARAVVDFTGPTMTVNFQLTPIDVGVLGDVDSMLVDFLRAHDVAAGRLTWSTAIDLSGYEVVVVNGGESVGPAEFAALESAAADAGTGLVYTGTWGSEGGIRLLEKFTDRVTVGVDGYGDGAVRLTDFRRKRRLFTGLTEPATVLNAGSYWSTIRKYTGPTLATQRVQLADGTTVSHAGAAFSWRTATDVEVLLASMAVTGAIGPDRGWSASGKQLFLNAVELARDP
jgi:subtilisin family serine protease